MAGNINTSATGSRGAHDGTNTMTHRVPPIVNALAKQPSPEHPIQQLLGIPLSTSELDWAINQMPLDRHNCTPDAH